LGSKFPANFKPVSSLKTQCNTNTPLASSTRPPPPRPTLRRRGAAMKTPRARATSETASYNDSAFPCHAARPEPEWAVAAAAPPGQGAGSPFSRGCANVRQEDTDDE
jgi:hypothetical protein